MNLPQDLVDFLAAGMQLEYDPDDCETGAIRLLRLDQLKLERFPMFIDSESELYENDPHRDDNGYYLVLGVNLVAECVLYNPCGLLMWYPLEQRFGTWDAGHWFTKIFGADQTWTEIVKSPAQHIEAQWGFPGSIPASPLQPWPLHPYSAQLQGRSPFAYEEL